MYAEFWEAASREKGRLYELAGYMAGAGEQLGLACLADHEFNQWASVDLSSAPSHEKVAAEMAQRALAELESYYVIGVGHALANMTGRVLALDPDLHEHLADAKYIKTTFTPFSNARQDWLSMNSNVACALQKAAAKSSIPSFACLADPAAELADSKPWREPDEVRGEHFHRWRSQSIGMTGAPKSSPWSLDSRTLSIGAGRMLGQDPRDPTAAIVRQTVAEAREALRLAAEDFNLRLRPRLPDEREAIEGARTASATAAGLLNDADILAGAGSYGAATSLAVLGFEESIKARTLGAIAAATSMGRSPGFSEDELRKIIYGGHRERHAAAFVQHLAAAFPDDYGKLMLGMPLSAVTSRYAARSLRFRCRPEPP
jgi:hypothetical protein